MVLHLTKPGVAVGTVNNSFTILGEQSLSRQGRAFRHKLWLIIFVSKIKIFIAQYFFARLFKRLRFIKRSLFLVLNKILS